MPMLKQSILLIPLLASSFANAMSLNAYNIAKCNISFTQEQAALLDKAAVIGEQYNLSKALQGILIQESFISNSVDRIREVSEYDSSYGVMHMRISTAEWVAKKAKLYSITPQEVKPFLSNPSGDDLSLQLAVHLLDIHIKGGYTWSESIARYNAGGYYKKKAAQKYLQSVKDNIKYVERCGYL